MDLSKYHSFVCPFDEEVLVLCLDPDKDEFSMPKESKWYFEMEMFETSHAFAVWEDVPQPLILFDRRLLGEYGFSADHLFILMAHELGHIHNKSLNEKLCDEYALALLKKHGLNEAVELYLAHLEND